MPDRFPGLNRILVGYDGSDPAARALRTALGLAEALGARVWVVHATAPPPRVLEPQTEEQRGSEEGAVEETMRRVRELAGEHRVELELVVREGPPAAVIERVAGEVSAELVVVGTRGLRGARQVLLGSVSAAVVNHGHRPTLVVP